MEFQKTELIDIDSNMATTTDAPANDDNSSIVSNNHGQNTDEQMEPVQGQEQQQPQRQSWWAIVKTLLVRGIVIYAISSFFRRGTPAKDATGVASKPGGMHPYTNIYLKDTIMDMYVYISEQQNFTTFDEKSLFWLEDELIYGDWEGGPTNDGTFQRTSQLPISDAVQNNGSLYLHVYVVKAGKSPNPLDKERYSEDETLYRTRQLNKFKKRKFHSSKNLLTGESDVHPDLIQKEEYNASFEVLSFWHPNLTINIIDDHTPWTPGGVPAPLDEYVEFLPVRNQYKPILYFNDFWNLNSDMYPINTSTPMLNISLTFYPLSLLKWQMYAAQGMKSKWYSFMGDDFMEENDDDQDSIKTALVETNPYLLGLTIVISMVHSVFEFLAFKNDIQFWRNRKSLEGLSVRSVFFNVFQSLIVVLYVMDNETNFVVRCSVVVGLGIEVWKIFKVVNVEFDYENRLLGFPRPSIKDKSTYTESDTKKYDMLAFRYLSWLLYPLLICYSIYSLFYVEHRGWYSWVLGMMYGFLLTFGFIMMTPQLFINYKLKSVAHLPWRMLTYKALNTFIDDLFAFVIKMPTLYRLGCFRDDIIFLIYVYQRYIYRVDPKRMNEFGTSGEMFEENGSVKPIPEGEVQESIEAKPQTEKKND